RTPEGEPNHCPVCGAEVRLEPSGTAGDAPCPNCGTLLWFNRTRNGIWFYEANLLEPIFEKVRNPVAAFVGMKPEEISLTTRLGPSSTPFAREVGVDSLDLVEVVMQLEEEFGVTIADEDAADIETVWDLCIALLKHRRDE